MWQDISEVIISYNRLWKLLLDKGIKQTKLKRLAEVSTNVIAELGMNEPVALETLAKLCTALKCDIVNVIEFNATKTNLIRECRI